MKSTKNNIAVVLSGGAAKGIAHIGFLKALNEKDIYPSIVSGCSAGAIVGYLYAIGFNTEEMLEYFYSNANIFSLNKVTTKKAGIFDTEKYISTLDKISDINHFGKLKCKLIVNAVDIEKGSVKYFDTGSELKRKVIASAAVPGIFTPVVIADSIYVDGGTMDNFPIYPLLKKGLNIFSSFAAMHKTIEYKKLPNTIKLVNRAGRLAFNSAALFQLDFCDHIIAPARLNEFGLWDTNKMKDIFEIGYEATKEYLETKR